MPKLPALRVRSVEPAITHDKSATITKILADQESLLQYQKQFDCLRVDPSLLKPALPFKPDSNAHCAPPARSNSIRKSRLEHRNSVLSGGATENVASEQQHSVLRQFPFAAKMHVEQLQQCAAAAQEHLAHEQEHVDAIETALPLEEQSRHLLWRNRCVWKTLQVVRTVQMASLEGECLRYLVFLALLFLVMAFSMRITEAYTVSLAIRETLTEDYYSGIETFETVANYDNFWSWVQLGLIPATFTTDKLIGGSNLLFGAVRFRQQRVRANSCDTPNHFGITSTTSPCYAGSLTDSTRDTAAFGPSGEYTYIASGLSTVQGRYGRSGDGGYVVDIPLSSTAAEAQAVVTTLMSNSWLSSPSRLVVVELTTVNVNVGLFSYVQIISEFNAGGSVMNIVRVFTVPISNWSSDTGEFLPTFVILSFVFLLLFTQFVWYCYRFKLNYARNVWNVLEIGTHVTFFAYFGYAWAYYVAHRDMDLNVTQSGFGIGLWLPADGWLSMRELFSFTLLFSMFGLYRYLRLQPRMAVLLDSVTNARKDIFWFVVAWSVTTFGFAVSAHLLFGATEVNYHRLDGSAFTLIRMMLGELDTMANLISSQFYVANAYFIIFAIFVTIILLNLFIGVVSEYFTQEHQRHQLMEAESRRRSCLLPQFDFYAFELLLRSWRKIITDSDASVCTRIRVFVLAAFGFPPTVGDMAGTCDTCRHLGDATNKERARDAAVHQALGLCMKIGICLEEVLWGYLEMSISQDKADQAEFLKSSLERFHERLVRGQVIAPTSEAHTVAFLPEFLSIPELAYVLQYQLYHPDLRPGPATVSDHRAADFFLFGCPVLNSHVTKENVARQQFGDIYVELSLLLARATDLQLEIESGGSSVGLAGHRSGDQELVQTPRKGTGEGVASPFAVLETPDKPDPGADPT